MATAIRTPELSADIRAFADEIVAEAENAFAAFRETGTITANGTVAFIERVPNSDILVAVGYPGPFRRGEKARASILGLDGTAYQGNGFGAARYTRVFQARPDITSLSHVHSPSLAAWAQTHQPLPISYVPVQRFHLARELPVYIDRRQEEQDFIIEKLTENRFTPAIIEANGGATVWGWKGLRDLAEFILLLEEGADIQIRAAAIGGSKTYGPGVLRQQWKMSQRYEEAKAEGLLPETDIY